MRAADDFPDYLAARWAPLVRVVVLLGWRRPLAERVVAATLGSCRRDWGELSETGDLDGEVLDTLLATTVEARRHGLGPDGPEDPADPDDDEAVEHHAATYAALDALPEHTRSRLVVAALLGRGPVEHATLADDVRRVATAVRVDPPPAAADLPTRLRPRRTGLLVLVGAAVVGALVAATYALGVLGPGDSDDPDDPTRPERLAPVEVVEVPNPLPLSWWMGGTLHLAEVSLAVPSVVDLVAVDDGAVLTDTAGRVVHVRADGERTVLGRHVPGSGLVARAEDAVAAWIEPGGTVVVRDLLTGAEVDHRRLDIVDLASVRLVAIDVGAVHLTSSYGDVRWEPGDTSTTVEQPPDLVDREAGTTLSRVDRTTLRVEQPFFSVGYTRPGRDGSVSPDGTYVVVTVADDRSAYGTVRVLDARTGERLPTGLGSEDVALVSRAGAGGTLTHVVVDRDALPGLAAGADTVQLELRACRVADGSCRRLVSLPAAAGLPVLADPS
ncbi:hypothetical protein [Nocardioides abyssi]|uniref:DNA-directed RNA polymerase specialized sigma24 family protein n=1 Tax=Nocardioides abyssi TaxID=3058370 RepID=A0ABT8EV08_9ACTN|nr:hypothetical protein [Nocardioides abyssi]MDN4161721.1 hypothetical protein [Nocardioides abyssi]